MPRVSGPELASRLLPLRPGLRALFMSGYPGGAPRDAPPGDRPLLGKPFTPSTLARKVREALDG